MVKLKKRKAQFETISKSSSQTKKLGKILAQEILGTLSQKAIVIGLVGDLGGGKTTFLQGFAKGLGVRERILSPTFIIMKKFEIPTSNTHHSISNFYHIDCYRIEKLKEVLDLGFKKIISDPKDIIVIEWADRIAKILPPRTLILHFEFVDQKTRRITIQGVK